MGARLQMTKLMTCALLFDRLRNVVPRVTSVEYQKPNKGYVLLGYIYESSETELLAEARCTRTDKEQSGELLRTMSWFGFNPVGQYPSNSWLAIALRKRGRMFTSREAKRDHLRREGYKAVLRFREKELMAELEELK